MPSAVATLPQTHDEARREAVEWLIARHGYGADMGDFLCDIWPDDESYPDEPPPPAVWCSREHPLLRRCVGALWVWVPLMTIGEREASDAIRAREYIDAARERVHVCTHASHRSSITKRKCEARMAAGVGAPVNLTDALFGPYRCRTCCSYGHDESDHR